MPFNKRTVYLFAALSTAGAAVWAQQNVTKPPAQLPQTKPPQDEDMAKFSTDVRRVVAPTTVVDKGGHLVMGLPKSAFSVYENDKPQTIINFKQEDVPVSMGLIIDNSGSMREKRKKVETAALDLVKASNKEDEVFVVNFNDTPYLDLPHEKEFTSNIDEMKEALARIDSRGGTAMRDAVAVSIDHLKQYARRDKKVLVVVTDGVDNASLINLENLVKLSQQSGVLIYAVGLLGEEDRSNAKKATRELQTLVTATGGDAFFPKELAEVDAIAQEVAKDIRNQYTIEYAPTDTALDGKFRQIKIVVNASGHPNVHTRSGYYATPDATPAKSSSK
ncbi:MAG TPA: VWA domain-containing protein [Bryobacteraceae bacterium]|jgi:VWFA-related protein|nr:VWA domain-containing protein [Bryobacteraceae bacterium]